jgi:LysR family glycine cleavage system transcriptional activator
MRRRLPSLNAIRAFEAAARHESFTKAADELCVTQGAVSQQVKSLEAELGLALFRRERQRLALTPAGRAYLATARDALDRLAEGTSRLLAQHKAGVLDVSASPNFAAKWLVHRLGRFAEAHPGIALRISATMHHVEFAREDVDLAIRHGDGRWPDLDVVKLADEQLFPVASPRLAGTRAAARRSALLARATLLHSVDRSDWSRWLAAAGIADVDVERGPVFSQASMAIDAAIDGQGIALARTALAAWDLVAGRLVRPFGPALDVPYAYWIVTPKGAPARTPIARFRDWLIAEAAEDARRLGGA